MYPATQIFGDRHTADVDFERILSFKFSIGEVDKIELAQQSVFRSCICYWVRMWRDHKNIRGNLRNLMKLDIAPYFYVLFPL